MGAGTVLRTLLGRRRPALSEGWDRHVAAHPLWAQLDDEERAAAAASGEDFAAMVRWEAARGFALTDEVMAVISSQAGLIALGLPDGVDAFGRVTSVIVHPSTMRFGRSGHGPAGTRTARAPALLGQAAHRGPIALSWDAVRRDARHPRHGSAVVLHELAHALDMLDDVVDGTPPLGEPDLLSRWVRVCTRELARLRAGEGTGVLRDYAATDAGEFFAVATEAFFTRPLRLEEELPEVHDLLRAYYGQDPAERARRAEAA